MGKKKEPGATTEIIRTLAPIVHDIGRPPAKAIGEGLAQAVRLALTPLNLVVWTMEQAKEWAEPRVAEILHDRGVPESRIQEPAPEVAGQIINWLRFPNQDESLRQLYLGLLASAMDRDGPTHPAYPDVLRQLSPAEARFLALLTEDDGYEKNVAALSIELESAGVAKTMARYLTFDASGTTLLPSSSVDNLIRLSIVVPDDRPIGTLNEADEWVVDKQYGQLAEAATLAFPPDEYPEGFTRVDRRISLDVTPFGARLINACLGRGSPGER